jgi:HD-like signal output (HDOD) protein
MQLAAAQQQGEGAAQAQKGTAFHGWQDSGRHLAALQCIANRATPPIPCDELHYAAAERRIEGMIARAMILHRYGDSLYSSLITTPSEARMTLEELFQNQHSLPSAPKVVEDLISSFDDAGVSVDDIAKKLSTDPVLSAKLLRLANSAYYHVSRSIGTVDDAVMMLGFVTVRTLVISAGLVSGFKTVPGLDLRQFWRYTLHTAVAAKWLAKESKENTDLAFTIAMMHGIGQLVLHAALPGPAQEIDKEQPVLGHGRLAAERAALGYDFAEVGAELALRWKFPAAFADTIRAFPDPLTGGPRLAAVIHLAAWRARIDEGKYSLDEIEDSYPYAVEKQLGLAPRTLTDSMPPPAEMAAGLDELVH